MKHIMILVSLCFSFLIAGNNTTYIKVDGMQCIYSCAGKVNSVVQKIDGVKESSVDFEKGIATVTYDDKKVGCNDIVSNLKQNTSYTVELVNAKKELGQCSSKKKENSQI